MTFIRFRPPTEERRRLIAEPDCVVDTSSQSCWRMKEASS